MSKDILGIFPSFGEGLTGGIETAAEAAWQTLEQVADKQGSAARLLCYGKTPYNAHRFPNAQFASIKIEALCAALTTRARPTTILVWHLGLLKLVLPLLRFRPRILLFLHGIEAWRGHDSLTRLLFRRVDAFLSNSAHTWERFLKYHPSLINKQNIVLPLGLGVPLSSIPTLPNSVPKTLMLSRLSAREDYKGHRELIHAWPKVLQRIPSAQLLIAGEGDLRPTLERIIAEKGLSRSVKTLGYISEKVKLSLLEQCRCLAMPSRNEGFGLVYLEAMRMGRPCLVSTEDAGREVVNPPEAGLAADLRAPDVLADAICRLSTLGPEWDAWSAASRNRYEQMFTREHFQQRLRFVLETVR